MGFQFEVLGLIPWMDFGGGVMTKILFLSEKVSEYDQEIPQSQTTVNHMAQRGRAAQPSRDTRKTN